MAPQREWFEKDYYAVLGVSKDAAEKEITRAYRQLAKRHHPDANPDNASAEEKFKDISAAYDVLSDAAKRKEYDDVRRMAASGFGGGGAGGFPGGSGGINFGFGNGGGGGTTTINFDDVDGGGLGDIFGSLFGNRGRRGGNRGSGPRRGGDLEAEVHLSFQDAVNGSTIAVQLSGAAPCAGCAGSGAAPGTAPEPCPECGGKGAKDVNQGPFSFSQICERCNGQGRIVKDPCPQCRGSGQQTRTREVKVRIPVGVADGQKVRVKGKGTMGHNGGPAGDLFVTVHVAPHPLFGRRGDDLLLRLPVSFTEAALGAEVRVPTLDQPVTLKVPPGTQNGKTLRVRGRGMPKSTGAGDLLVTIEVVVPQELSDAQRQAVEALAATEPGNPRAHLGV